MSLDREEKKNYGIKIQVTDGDSGKIMYFKFLNNFLEIEFIINIVPFNHNYSCYI